MEVRYKWGKFERTVAVMPGDRFTCILTESDPDTHKQREQRVTEEIKTSMLISHWLMFYIPQIGSIGGMFGGPEIVDRVAEIFCNPVEVKDAFLTV